MRHGKWILAAALAAAALLIAALGRPASVRDYGYRPDPEGVRRFAAELDQPYFSQAGADAMRQAKGQDTFLYRYLNRSHLARYGTPFVVGKQGIGSCVAWGAMHAVAISQAIDWSLGKIPEPPLMPATEAIYGGSRVEARRDDPGGIFDGSSPVGGWSDGSYGAAAARFLRDWGVVYRQKYETCDLTAYDGGKTEKEWGAYGCGGRPPGGAAMDREAQRHPCKHVVQVRTWDELSAAIESGFPCTVASMQGFSSYRNKDGIAEAQGTWAHQMVIVGIRHKANGSPEDCALILNSWGPGWCGPKENRWPEDQPDGSFWARRPVVERMIRGDTWAIGSVDGFGYRDLDHGGWLAPPPEDFQTREENHRAQK